MSHRQSAARRWVLERVRRFNKWVTNPFTLTFAGRRIFAVVFHVGRRSGKSYRTPVLARPFDGGVVIPLTYGDHVDWCRNVIAAGGCTLLWEGAAYEMVAPEIVDARRARPAFSPRLWRMLHRNKIDKFLTLKKRP